MTTKTAIRERPILYSSEMVLGLLDGTKTMTRRVVKDFPPWATRWYPDGSGSGLWMPDGPSPTGRGTVAGHWRPCPHGRIGDRLWVREVHWRNGYLSRWCGTEPIEPHWITNSPLTGHESISRAMLVRFEDPGDPCHWKKCPSIHLPRWACRIVLEITEVRVERAHDISDADILAEGIAGYAAGLGLVAGDPARRRELWIHLWDSINGRRDGGAYAWCRNPWLWAITFRRLEATHA